MYSIPRPVKHLQTGREKKQSPRKGIPGRVMRGYLLAQHSDADHFIAIDRWIQQMSTPEEKCIGFPEQKCISEAGKKGR